MSKDSKIFYKNEGKEKIRSLSDLFIFYASAIQDEETDLCISLLEENHSFIYESDNNGMTPLLLAALHKHLDIVKLIFNYERADQLASLGDNEKLAFKFQSKLALAADKYNGWTALHIIARHNTVVDNDLSIFELFLNNNDNIASQGSGMYKEGMNPLDYAVLKSNYAIAEMLFDWNPELALKRTIRSSSPLKKAVKQKDKHMIDLYLKRNPNLQGADSDLAHEAARVIHKEIQWKNIPQVSNTSKAIKSTDEHIEQTNIQVKNLNIATSLVSDSVIVEKNNQTQIKQQNAIRCLEDAISLLRKGILSDHEMDLLITDVRKTLDIHQDIHISSSSTHTEDPNIPSANLIGVDTSSANNSDSNIDHGFSIW
ncbi:MAG: ankyrin repeat domain-containing protein [Rickettsiaceae bacterium]|nr:MAG: ankyrin repeat domain-containing protein [Rickettsiaceae bacterium]